MSLSRYGNNATKLQWGMVRLKVWWVYHGCQERSCDIGCEANGLTVPDLSSVIFMIMKSYEIWFNDGSSGNTFSPLFEGTTGVSEFSPEEHLPPTAAQGVSPEDLEGEAATPEACWILPGSFQCLKWDENMSIWIYQHVKKHGHENEILFNEVVW